MATTVKAIQPPPTNRMPKTGGLLNGDNQPVIATQPAIRIGNTRK